MMVRAALYGLQLLPFQLPLRYSAFIYHTNARDIHTVPFGRLVNSVKTLWPMLLGYVWKALKLVVSQNHQHSHYWFTNLLAWAMIACNLEGKIISSIFFLAVLQFVLSVLYYSFIAPIIDMDSAISLTTLHSVTCYKHLLTFQAICGVHPVYTINHMPIKGLSNNYSDAWTFVKPLKCIIYLHKYDLKPH